MGLQEEIAKMIEKLQSSHGKWIKIDYRPVSGDEGGGFIWHRYGSIKGKLYLKIEDVIMRDGGVIILNASSTLMEYDSYKKIFHYTDEPQTHRIKIRRSFKATNPNISLAMRKAIRSKFE